MADITNLAQDGRNIEASLEQAGIAFNEYYVNWVNQLLTQSEAFQMRGDEVNPSDHDPDIEPFEIMMIGKDFDNNHAIANTINSTLEHTLQKMNLDFGSTLIGGKPAIIREFQCPSFQHQVFDLLTKPGAKQWFENKPAYKAFVDNRGNLQVKTINIIDEWWRWPGRKSFPKGIVMAPNQSPADAYNLFQGFSIKPTPGNWDLMQRLILEGICDNDHVLYEWVLDWMATGIQYPETLKGIALVMRGAKGIGKGQFAKYYGQLFGQHFLHITQERHLTGNFNSHQAQALLMFADELIWGGNKQSEGVLKALITEDSFMLERKGFDSHRIRNYMRLVVASNESWAVPAGSGERRWCVCDCSTKFKDDYVFFADLEHQMLNGGLEAMMHDLLHRQITTNQRKAPRTAALTDIAVKGFTSVEQWLFTKLEKHGSSFGQHFDPSSQVNFTGTSIPISWGGTVTADELYADYKIYCDHNKIRSRETKDMLCKKTKHLLGLNNPTRPLIKRIKTTTYQLPAFSTARDEFAKAVDLDIEWD